MMVARVGILFIAWNSPRGITTGLVTALVLVGSTAAFVFRVTARDYVDSLKELNRSQSQSTCRPRRISRMAHLPTHRPAPIRRAWQFMRVGLVAFALIVVLDLALSLAFPMGGGRYHAIFAYTKEGRLGNAYAAYIIALTSLALASVALVWFRSTHWWIVALVASTVGVWSWWSVCSWQPQSDMFHQSVLRLLPGIPLVLVSVCFGTESMWRWRQRRRQRRAERRRSNER